MLGVLSFLVFVTPLSVWLVSRWERSYPSVDGALLAHVEEQRGIHIVVLGAGYDNDPLISVTSQLGENVALRLMEAVRIYRKVPDSKIITSGSMPGKSRTQAEAVAEAALSLGVSAADTLHLPWTENTEAEAVAYSEKFLSVNKNSLNIQCKVILVTSALHMKRAVFWFEKHGIKIIPAPCDYYVKYDLEKPRFDWYPLWKKAGLLDAWLREVVGLLWAKFKTSSGN